eukprot:1371914-Amorphochlora_amoeboformis.AAC.1
MSRHSGVHAFGTQTSEFWIPRTCRVAPRSSRPAAFWSAANGKHRNLEVLEGQKRTNRAYRTVATP